MVYFVIGENVDVYTIWTGMGSEKVNVLYTC